MKKVIMPLLLAATMLLTSVTAMAAPMTPHHGSGHHRERTTWVCPNGSEACVTNGQCQEQCTNTQNSGYGHHNRSNSRRGYYCGR